MSKSMKKLLAVLAASALVPVGALAQKKEPVMVGLVSSKSGTFAQQGEEVLRAVQFAIDEANARGGVDGREVKVQVADDESTPEAGRRVAEKLSRDGYNLLIGPIASSISLALAQNLERWDAAYFTVASKSDKLTGDTCRPRSFRTNHSDAMDLAMIGEWAKEFKEKSFAVLAADIPCAKFPAVARPRPVPPASIPNRHQDGRTGHESFPSALPVPAACDL